MLSDLATLDPQGWRRATFILMKKEMIGAGFTDIYVSLPKAGKPYRTKK